jgi:putative lipoprotein
MHIWVSTLFFALLFGCQPKGGDAGTSNGVQKDQTTISGVISYRERKSLPPDAEVRMRLVDLNQTGDAKVISAIDFLTEGNQIPLDFAIPYEPDQLDENGNFALEGDIIFAGMYIFEEMQPVSVITNGKRKDVVVMMRSTTGKVEE